MPQQSSLFSDDNYADFLNGLKSRIRTAQVKAALAVNQELILLYWQIGRDILARQEGEKWGSGSMPPLSASFCAEAKIKP